MDPEKSSTKKGVDDANLNTIEELRHCRINAYGVSIEACATTNKTNASFIPQPKKKRKSITAAQSARADAKRLAEHKKKAHKRATILYEQQLEKPANHPQRMSSATVVATVAEEFDWAPSARSVERYVKAGMAGCSPMKKG